MIVIEGRSPQELREEQIRTWEEMGLEEHLEHYMSMGQDKKAFYTDQGMDRKEAMKAVARDRGITKRDVYQQLL